MIEDIDYLKENSVKETYVFIIDSKNRDKKIWRFPEKYRIDFNTPFKHVYSFEILQAVIPRTQFAIDDHNNILRFKFKEYDWTQVEVGIGDYNVTNLIDNLNSLFAEKGYDIVARNASSPAYLKSTLEFVSPHHFALDMESSSMNTVLGFDLYNQHETDKYKHLKDHLEYTSRIIGGVIEYHPYIVSMVGDEAGYEDHIDRWFGSIETSDRRSFTGTELITNLGDYYTLPMNKALYQVFTFDQDTLYDSGYIEAIQLQLNNLSSATSLSWEIRDYSDGVVGSQTIADSNSAFSDRALSNVSEYVLILSDGVDAEGNMTAITFDTHHNNDGINNAFIMEGSTKVEVLDSYDSHFNICFSVVLYKKLNKITAPGMYSLLGERYVTLRCPEIETHLFRSLSYDKHTMGLAKFDLHVQGYDSSRLDFTSLPPREFHPIGKLNSLTFEFQNPDGSLYNFRGINHTMTIVMRYHTPRQLKKFEKSLMNPDYDPDIFRYIQNKGHNTDSDSDSEP